MRGLLGRLLAEDRTCDMRKCCVRLNLSMAFKKPVLTSVTALDNAIWNGVWLAVAFVESQDLDFEVDGRAAVAGVPSSSPSLSVEGHKFLHQKSNRWATTIGVDILLSHTMPSHSTPSKTSIQQRVLYVMFSSARM